MNILHGTWLGNRCWCSTSGKIGTSSFNKMSSHDKIMFNSNCEVIKIPSNVIKKAKRVTNRKRRQYDKKILFDELQMMLD